MIAAAMRADSSAAQNKWRREENMIAAQAVNATLRGIREDAFLERGLADAFSDVVRRRKRLARGFVFDEFDANQQAKSANVANMRMRQQRRKIAAKTFLLTDVDAFE